MHQDNLNILRDAAHLQMQLRHFDQLVETRQILLKHRVNVRQSWAAMAVAYHLNGQLESATKVLELYEKTVKDIPPYDPEHSELLLYRVAILEEMGSLSEALNLLDLNAKSRSITDRSMILVIRGIWYLPCCDHLLILLRQPGFCISSAGQMKRAKFGYP